MRRKERIAVRPLSLGLRDSRNPVLLQPGETPFAENVEFDEDSLRQVGGTIKMNNRAVSPIGVRTRAPEERHPLSSKIDGKTVSVPARGYVTIPYRKAQDIGGQVFGDRATTNYSDTKGRDFEIKVSFKIPESEKLYGPGAETGKAYLGNGNEALDECFCIVQKGGDRWQPMSWALAVINVGDAETYDMITGGSNFGDSPTTYRLAFIWLDAPKNGFDQPGQNLFAYNLESEVGAPATSGTVALRAVVVDQAIEVGKEYHVSVGLKIDTGSAGRTSTSWNDDGYIKVNVAEGTNDPVEYSYVDTGTPTQSGIHVWKGPQDSLEYLCKYGIRYAGREEMYLGLGYRMTPYVPGGGIIYGMDASPLEGGGFSMNSIAGFDAYMTGDADAVLGTITHADSDPYFEIDKQYLTDGSGSSLTVATNTIGTRSYSSGVAFRIWFGQGDGSTIYNSECLRGYHVVRRSTSLKQIYTVEQYTESGASYRLNCFDLENSSEVITEQDYYVYPFRWNQRDLIISDFRIYDTPTDYSNVRSKWSLGASIDITDNTEPNIENLIGYWPLDDGGEEGVCKDCSSSNDAYLGPMSFATGERGTRGKNQIYLSGEGEALALDLSENPVFKREFLENLNSQKMGFAVQVTMRLTGAEYSCQQVHPDPEDDGTPQLQAAFAPDLISWDVKSPGSTGLESDPHPLFTFGYKARSTTGQNARYGFPLGFSLEIADASDQSGDAMFPGAPAWDGTDPNYSVYSCPWAGEVITFQVGIHPGSTDGEYIPYVAGAPAFLLAPSDKLEGVDPNGEYVVFGAATRIERKDIERSVITIGGGWRPSDFGYTGNSARVIVDDVRVFAGSAPGALPATNGGVTSDGSGKILGARSLPQDELQPEDMLFSLGNGLSVVSVTDQSSTVTSASNLEFYNSDAKDTADSLDSAYLRVANDSQVLREEQTLGDEQEEFYAIKSVTGSGSSSSGSSELELYTPYDGQSATTIGAKAFRVVGYTAFNDYIYEHGMPTSVGSGYKPGVTTSADVVLSDDLWSNTAPVSGDWKVRFYSPISGSHINDIASGWAPGFVEPRRNPIRGLHGQGKRIYAQAGGGLYEVDDRWRKTYEGTETLDWIEFKSQAIGPEQTFVPMAGDRIEVPAFSQMVLNDSTTGAGKTRVIDFEVSLNDVRGLQTVYQVVDVDTLSTSDAADNGFEMNHWVRFKDGVPQIVFGRDATYDGANKPTRNFWVATAANSIRPEERSHVRWIVEDDGDNYQVPICCINGKKVNVTVDTVENSLTGTDWISNSTATPDSATMLIGTAVDSDEESELDQEFTYNEIRGRYLKPRYRQGFLYSLNGALRKLRVINSNDFNASNNPNRTDYNFNWRDITYPTSGVDEICRIDFDEGVGHKVEEKSQDQYAVIYSHPFIPLYVGMKKTGRPAAFATMGDSLYVTNGGRPVVFDEDYGAKIAGLTAPASKPDFEIERLPLWTPTATEATYDPTSVDHTIQYATHKAKFLTQEPTVFNRWELDKTIAFKGFVKPFDVDGKIRIFGSGTSPEAGGCRLEIVDGKARLGWYDPVQRKNVYVETSAQVFYPGRWHYVYFRKKYPTGTDNWNNQILHEDASNLNDMLVVRVLTEESITPGGTWVDSRDFKLNSHTDTTDDTDSQHGGTIDEACVSFTSGNDVSGTSATGCVTKASVNYSMTTGGVVTAGENVFANDMVGRQFQFTGDEIAYRVIKVTADNTCEVEKLNGDTPGVTKTSEAGGVFMGIELVQSEGFAESKDVDETAYQLELFGSSLTNNPTNGLSPFNGEFSSFGYVITDSNNIFESAASDFAQTGVDVLGAYLNDNQIGPNDFTAANTTAAVQETEPNDDMELALAAAASDQTDPFVWENIKSFQMLNSFRRVRITFFDPDQNVESNPGPELLIDPVAEDETGESNAARIKLTNLPVSPRGGNIHRRIYMTNAGAHIPVRVATLEENTSDTISISKDEFEISIGEPVLYDQNAPPRCGILASGNGIMYYADLEDQRDGVLFSKPFRPSAVPFGNFLIFETGDNEPITGLHEQTGRMLVFKRDSIFGVNASYGGTQQQSVARGVGSVSHNSIRQIESRTYFIDTRGVMMLPPYGEPVRVSEPIDGFFGDEWDKSRQEYVYGSINRNRDQYVFAAKSVNSDRFDIRYAVEWRGGAQHRFSRFRGPDITAMTTLMDRNQESHLMVGGTEDGFVVWMDRSDTALHMMGPDTDIWGDTSFTVVTGDSAPVATITTSTGNELDTDLSGSRGARIYWQLDGIEYEAIILAQSGTTIMLDAKRSRNVTNNSTAVVGATRPQYRSAWFDLQQPELMKKSVVLDFTRGAQASGSLTVKTYQSLEDTVIDTVSLDQTEALGHIPTSAFGGNLQFRLSEPVDQAGTTFEIIDIVWRIQVADTW